MKVYKKAKQLSLGQKIFLTILLLIVYRLCSHIPLPFVNNEYISALIGGNGSLGLLNTLTGGNLANMSIMALGITPYITASIVLQLLGVCFPVLSEMQKEGSTGQAKYKKITVVFAVVLALLQSLFMIIGYGQNGMLSVFTWYSVLIPTVIMTGSVFVLSFMGQYITDKLFGNGISLILVTGILCGYLSDGQALVTVLTYGKTLLVQVTYIVAAIVVVTLLFMFTVWLNYCEKKIIIVYSGKVANGNLMSSRSIIPLKLIGGSVVPVIFASSLLTIPSFVQSFTKSDIKWLHMFDMSHWLSSSEIWANIGLLLYFVMIIGFSYYYQHLNLNEKEIAVNLKRCGGTIAGIRPGKPTEMYLYSQMKYLTLLGGFGLCIIAFIPIICMRVLNISNLSFFGTSVIIVVSVIADTFKQYDADKQCNKNYGFRKAGFKR